MAGPGLIGGMNLVGGLIAQGERIQDRMADMFDAAARRQAGAAMAGGRTREAAAILGERGMLKETDALMGQATTQDALSAASQGDYTAAREAAAQGGDPGLYGAMTKEQATEAADRAEWIMNAATSLKGVPAAQRQQVFAQQFAPVLKAMNLPDEVIAQMGAGDMSDANLDAMAALMGQERQKFQFFQTGEAIYRGDPNAGTVEEALSLPEDPEEAEDRRLDREYREAQIAAMRGLAPLRQAQADKARRPPAARSSRGGSSGGQPWKDYQ